LVKKPRRMTSTKRGKETNYKEKGIYREAILQVFEKKETNGLIRSENNQELSSHGKGDNSPIWEGKGTFWSKKKKGNGGKPVNLNATMKTVVVSKAIFGDEKQSSTKKNKTRGKWERRKGLGRRGQLASPQLPGGARVQGFKARG